MDRFYSMAFKLMASDNPMELYESQLKLHGNDDVQFYYIMYFIQEFSIQIINISNNVLSTKDN